MIKRKQWPFTIDAKAGGEGEAGRKAELTEANQNSDSEESADDLPQNLNRRTYAFSESETEDESEEESSEGQS